MKRVYIIITSLLLLFLSGCGVFANYREIELLQLVETVGFDDSGGRVRLSVSSGGAGEGGAPLRMSAEESSVKRAEALIQDYSSSEELFYDHARYVLLGESAAKNAGRYLDYVERSVQIRLDVPLIVVRGDARTLVMDCGGEKSDVTQALASLERDAMRRGDARFFTCAEVAASLAGSGAALCVCVRTADAEEVSGEKGVTPLPDGFAILKDGELAGFIDPENSRGVALLRGELDAGYAVLPGGVTVELSGGSAELSPVWSGEGELLSLDVELTLSASVLESEKPLELEREDVRALLGTLLAREAAGWVERVLGISKELGADFLGLGKKLSLDSPGNWAAMEGRWPEALKSLPIRVTAGAEILRGYDITGPLNVGGEG